MSLTAVDVARVLLVAAGLLLVGLVLPLPASRPSVLFTRPRTGRPCPNNCP